MPRFDGTGSWGQGQGTGWGMGPCACPPSAYASGISRRGAGMGQMRGFCRGRRFYTKKEEAAILEEEAKELQEELKAVQEKLAEIKDQK